MMELEAIFTFVFLLLGIPLIIAELYGVYRENKGDTISEHWWALRNRYPWLKWPMLGFTLWLTYHFFFEGWV
jgi:hypothetical protein